MTPMTASATGPAAAGPGGILQRQMEAVRQMLSFNSAALAGATGAASGNGEPVWKVLVYDAVGKAILSPLFNVKQLRDNGVTLHILLQSQRDPVPDVPAIYFCQPTDENLERIGQDLESGLYGSYHFNFISSISRQKLEDLAARVIRASAVGQVEKVYDQHLNFISLENHMFTLGKDGSSKGDMSYHSLNRSDVTDQEMEGVLSRMVDGLFAVCVTLGTVPIIRCPKGNAAEAVATRLDRKLRENLKDARNSLFSNEQSGQFSFYRPLLVLLDRQVDLATPLHHTWTYQALAHDVLNYKLNRVTLTDPESELGAKGRSRTCDLDNSDAFWYANKGAPFPEVAERIQEALEEYKSKEEDVRRMKRDMGLEEGEEKAISMLSDNTQRLTSAVSSLPALLERKALIDMHTCLATAMLDQIKLRKLDLFFELEEKIMSKQTLDRSLMQVFEDPEAGTPEDKIRLFLIYYICTPSISEAELEQYSHALQEGGCDMAALDYVKRWKSLTSMTSLAASSADYGGGGTKTVNMFSKLMAQSSQFVMEGVKNLVVKRHNLPVTRIVEELMEVKPGQHQEEYRYFDPKILRGQESIPRAKNPFQEAIVFMVGGGNYIEYQNLMDFTSSKNLGSVPHGMSHHPGKRVIYGCSTLSNANQVLQQLAELGHKM